ncbi:MAG: hypothetical protein ACJAYC_001974 [Halieaceae bacterium]|jgi:hypothetical protein
MSIRSWDPDASTAAKQPTLEPETLQRFIEFSQNDQLTELETLIDSSESQVLAGLMKADHSQWIAAVKPLADVEIIHLIRFFTIAESLPGWEAGAESPVIPLAKTLRKRGQRLDKDLLLWLRDVSDNRYLPYGPL